MTRDEVQTKAQYLMESIDRLREAMSEKDTGFIDLRRAAERKYGLDHPVTRSEYSKCGEVEEAIDAMLCEYRELVEEDAVNARAEADAMEVALQQHDVEGIELLKDLGYVGNSENVLEALLTLKSEGYRLRKKEPTTGGG